MKGFLRWMGVLAIGLFLAACQGAPTGTGPVLNAPSTAAPLPVGTPVGAALGRRVRVADAVWATSDPALLQAAADALGISADELLSRLGDGETLLSIAQSLGYTSDDLLAMAQQAIDSGLLPTQMLGAGAGSSLAGTGDGVLQPYIVQAWADALGLSVEELQARLDAGENLGMIAVSLGYSPEEVWALMSEVRAAAVEQALADGVITEEQAAWLLSTGQRQMQNMGQATPGGAGFGRGQQRRPTPLATPMATRLNPAGARQYAAAGATGTGVLTPYVREAWAQILGIPVDELNARLNAGETIMSIALAQGINITDFRALQDQVRALAVEQALADGVITQLQADSILNAGQVRGQGAGAGSGAQGQGRGQGRGGGRWTP